MVEPGVTGVPGSTAKDARRPASGASTAISVFMDSTSATGSPASTQVPGVTACFQSDPATGLSTAVKPASTVTAGAAVGGSALAPALS